MYIQKAKITLKSMKCRAFKDDEDFEGFLKAEKRFVKVCKDPVS